jgi:hypothetical protein
VSFAAGSSEPTGEIRKRDIVRGNVEKLLTLFRKLNLFVLTAKKIFEETWPKHFDPIRTLSEMYSVPKIVHGSTIEEKTMFYT